MGFQGYNKIDANGAFKLFSHMWDSNMAIVVKLEHNQLCCTVEYNQLGSTIEHNQLCCTIDYDQLGCTVEHNQLCCTVDTISLAVL